MASCASAESAFSSAATGSGSPPGASSARSEAAEDSVVSAPPRRTSTARNACAWPELSASTSAASVSKAARAFSTSISPVTAAAKRE